MNVWKKVIALIAAAIMLIRFLMFSCFAVGAAPVAAEELAEVLIAMLTAAGHSQSELSGMSVTQMQSLLNDDLNSGKINHGTILIDPVTQAQITVMDYVQSDKFKQDKAIYDLVRSSIAEFAKEALVGSDYYFTPTPTIDLMGNGAVMYRYGDDGKLFEVFYCDYVVWDDNSRRYYFYGDSLQYLRYGRNGNVEYSSFLPTGYSISFMENCKFYGDVRTLDGEDYPTDDTYEYVLGEADGTKVTVDMLNPDGTVTIDGVTYYPADYLDPDKLTDTGKDSLLAALLAALANTYVKSDDKPIVDDKDITVEVSEELEDFTVPTGIISVFPFCLPFDFLRGIKTLVQKPKVPVFKAELDLTNICGYDLGKHEIEISLEKWEPAAVVCRWFFILLFTYTLILITPRICKGAG